MSRFGKLEFEPDHTGTTEQRPMAGEAHWFGEAGRSFHRGEFICNWPAHFEDKVRAV